MATLCEAEKNTRLHHVNVTMQSVPLFLCINSKFPVFSRKTRFQSNFLVFPFLIKIARLLVLSVFENRLIYSRNHTKEPRFFLGSLERFLSNGLVFSSPACKVLDKVLIYQFFLNIGHCKN